MEVEPTKTTAHDLSEPFSWHAPETRGPARGLGWYLSFAMVIIVLMALSVFWIKSWTFTVLIPIMAVALLSLSTKTPRMINYAISPKGVYVADKLYDFSEFKAFGVIEYQGQFSVLLLPVKRFSPGLTIYFSEAEGETIVDMLGTRLPMQEIKPDALEKLIRIIKL